MFLDNLVVFGSLLETTLVYGLPLMIVALAGVFSERSGVINIGLEGMMIVGAAAGFGFSLMLVGGNLENQFGMFLSIIVAGLAGAAFSYFLAVASIKFKADQVIVGTALNLFAPAFAIVFARAIDPAGLASAIGKASFLRISRESLGISEGSFLYNFTNSVYLTTPVIIILFALGTLILYKTAFGLRLRSCGEHPQAADSVGINVSKMRYFGTIIGGFLAGIGGFAFAIVIANTFDASVAGYGFLALAVMIFSNWKPKNIIFAALFFSFFKVVSIGGHDAYPFLPALNLEKAEYIYQMLPYVLTLIILAFTSKRSQAPAAEGIPYDKGQR